MKYSLICLCPQNKVCERNIYAKREGSESAIFRSRRGKSLFIDKEKPWSERVSVHGKASNWRWNHPPKPGPHLHCTRMKIVWAAAGLPWGPGEWGSTKRHGVKWRKGRFLGIHVTDSSARYMQWNLVLHKNFLVLRPVILAEHCRVMGLHIWKFYRFWVFDREQYIEVLKCGKLITLPCVLLQVTNL